MERLLRLLLGDRMELPTELAGEILPRGVTVRRGRLVPALGGILIRLRGPAAAVTLRRTIVVGPGIRLTPALLAHELTHVRQWRSEPFFPLRYCLATLRHGYLNNPYEIEARAVAAASTSASPPGPQAS